MKLSLILFVVVALGTQGVHGQPKAKSADPPGSLQEVLAKNTPQFRALLDIIKVTPAAVPKTTVGTFFASNDAAIAAFLKSMGLTAKDLMNKPELVDLIVAYHFVPGYQVTGAEVANATKRAGTGDDNYFIRLAKGPTAGKLSVQDVQGNKAAVVTGPIKAGKVNVYVIDKVLLSGNYFTDTMSALKHYPSWITTYGYITQTGVDKALAAVTTGYTLFVPSVKAWKPVEPQVTAMSNGGVADSLRYHVVAGAREVPKDFKNETLQTLLTGHSIKVMVDPKRTELNPYSRKVEPQPLVRLTPEVGKPAEVQTYNIYAGKNILQGIDRVLLPGTSTAVPAATSGTAAAATTMTAPSQITTEAATKPASAAISPTTNSSSSSNSSSNSTATATPTTSASAGAAATKPAVAAFSPTTPAGRHLLHIRRLLQPIKSLEIGTTQTDASGVGVGTTLAAITAAASGLMPVQYRNRFGSFGVEDEADGCLNCLAWSKGR